MNEQKLDEQENEKLDEYYGYSLFNDVEDMDVRAYNRCIVIFNIMDAHGMAPAEEYSMKVDAKGQMEMWVMFNCITSRGLDSVKAEMSRGGQILITREDKAMEESKNATKH